MTYRLVGQSTSIAPRHDADQLFVSKQWASRIALTAVFSAGWASCTKHRVPLDSPLTVLALALSIGDILHSHFAQAVCAVSARVSGPKPANVQGLFAGRIVVVSVDWSGSYGIDGVNLEQHEIITRAGAHKVPVHMHAASDISPLCTSIGRIVLDGAHQNLSGECILTMGGRQNNVRSNQSSTTPVPLHETARAIEV